MKRTRRRLSEDEKVQAWLFKLATVGLPCVVCGKPATEAHHAIEAQWLRRNLPQHVYDTRLSVPTCGGCHAGHTTAKARIPRDRLPRPVEDFAAEQELGWYLDRYYPAREAA